MIEVSCNAFMSKSCVHFENCFSQEVLLDLVEKTKQEYALPKLKECYCVIISFDLWMLKGGQREHMMFLPW
jgi:hypothetical protein